MARTDQSENNRRAEAGRSSPVTVCSRLPARPISRAGVGHKKIRQYRVLERLGKGGMASVFRATDAVLGREVALKILRTGFDDAAARFRVEAAALARLNHPAIATVYELFEDDERLVMAMELVRGQTLQHIIEHVGVFAPRRAAELCMQTLAGLDHAHTAGVVHRDLKPGNLMLTQAGAIKIMDFGIARFDESPHLTNAGAMLGTPAYMAPEQVLGHAADARSDLYAMGIVFFRLVTGALPFAGGTPFALAQAQVNAVPRKAREIRSDLPEWVDEILTRALAKAPADRFQSAMEFHEAFARVVASMPSLTVTMPEEATELIPRPEVDLLTPTGVVDAAGTPSRRRARWAVAGTAAAAGLTWIILPSAFTTAGTRPSEAGTITAPPADAQSARSGNTDQPEAPRDASVAADGRARGAGSADGLPAGAAELPPVSFNGLKMLTVNGTSTTASDVELEFTSAQVRVRSTDGKTMLAALSYRGIGKATYTHANDPKWAAGLSGPAGPIDVPGIFGRDRHWLVLQGRTRYVILRLDDGNRLELMKALEDRSGIAIDRTTPKRPD